MKTALVLGAGGFIGHHLVRRLKDEGYWVRGVDLRHPEFSSSLADEFILGDLRDPSVVQSVIRFHSAGGEGGGPRAFDEVYQLAADMGGAGYLFTGNNDADILHNSVLINLHVLDGQQQLNAQVESRATRIFFSSSACVYPEYNQLDPLHPNCSEDSVYPADPDSEYGWEKLFSERLYFAYARNYGIPVKVGRFHNVFGVEGTWTGGKEKAPAAICRKVAAVEDGGSIEIWGDGEQTRSFLYVDDCVEAVRRLMSSNFPGPVNIGSEELVSINELVDLVAAVAGKSIAVHHREGPLGVRGRNSDNALIREKLEWEPMTSLREGIAATYRWIDRQLRAGNGSDSR